MTEFGTQGHVAGRYGTTRSTPDALLTRNTKRCLNRLARATPEGANAWTRSCCHKQHGMHSRRVYQATTFPLGGDHAGVENTAVVLPKPQSPDPEVISIRDWTGRDLKRFRAHMGRSYRAVPKNMTMETASNMVLKEVARYVAAHKKPNGRPYQAHEDLQTRLPKNPCGQAALKQWGEHMQRKHHKEVMKKLRRFRKSAIGGTGTFFAELATWLVKPAHVCTMSPSVASATKKLPDFAGDPQWDPEKTFNMLPNLRVPGAPVGQTLQTWRGFQETANQPKKKSMGMDGVPPHTIQWLPEKTSW